MLRMRVDGVTATAAEKEVLTAGRVGLKCAFEFGSGDWGGLFKTAVFQGIETVDVALPENECTVPWEAMAVEGVQLKVGVYGANGDGDIVIPTVWANFGKIQPSATPSGVDPQNPSQNANAYAVETAEQALAIAQSVRDDADNGDFDGADGTDGVSPEVTIASITGGHSVTITDADHPGGQTFNVMDGADGSAGADGDPGSQIWTTSTAPSHLLGVYTFSASNLKPTRLALPKVGDLILYSDYVYTVTEVSGTSVKSDIGVVARVNIKGDTGAAGPGVAAGGTTGQVLKKKSGTDYDTEWANESGGGGTPYTSNPEMDGEASPGSSDELSRGDHVHPSDTSRQAKITANGILKGDGNGGVTAATAGTDYLVTAPVTSVNGQTGAVTVSVPAAATSNPSALGTAAVGSSTKYAKEDHVHPLPLKYTTLTIATTDWSSLSCTKTVTGMTTTAIVWLEYSDTTTAFTCTQGTDSLTFGCDATPSAAVTVKVAFMEGVALS